MQFKGQCRLSRLILLIACEYDEECKKSRTIAHSFNANLSNFNVLIYGLGVVSLKPILALFFQVE